MLRYIKDNLATIDGIEIFPIISLVIFFSLFVGLAIHIMKTDRKKIERLKRLPLDDEN